MGDGDDSPVDGMLGLLATMLVLQLWLAKDSTWLINPTKDIVPEILALRPACRVRCTK